MRKLWQLELNKCLLICISGGLLGWGVEMPWAGAFLFLFLYVGWLLLYLKELATWLETPGVNDPPEASGLWGRVFDDLYRQKKKNRTINKKLKKTIETSRLSTNAIRDAVVLINENSTLEWWNKAAKNLLGLQRRSDRNHPITNLLRDPNFVAYFERGEYLTGITIPSPINPEIVLHLTISFYTRKKRILIARDVTQLHHLEQVRKDFVANVSHELRTPLTVIKGYIETFLDMLTPENNTGAYRGLHRGLSQVEQQTLRMEALVNDLLLLSKLETDASKKIPAPINIAVLLQEIYSDSEAINDVKQHQITLNVEEGVWLLGDITELRSAFSNIVFNAVNYTPAQGTVDIRWWKDKDGAHLAVSDNGVGIDPIHIPRLTERFYRADPSRHAKSGGTGLGLAIVKHSLRHHEATLDIQSNLDKGSVFTCHFPKRKIITPSTTPPLTPSNSPTLPNTEANP